MTHPEIVDYKAAKAQHLAAQQSTQASEYDDPFKNEIVKLRETQQKFQAGFRAAVCEAYRPLYSYLSADKSQQKAWDVFLKQQMTDAGYRYLEITKGTQMIVKLAFGDDNSKAWTIVHFACVAKAKHVKPADIEEFYIQEGGPQKVKVKYDKDGNLRSDRQVDQPSDDEPAADEKPTRDEAISTAKEALETKVIYKASKQALADKVIPVKKDTVSTAIIVRYPDGSFVIKAVIDDAKVLDAAYESYGYHHANDVAIGTTTPTVSKVDLAKQAAAQLAG